MAEERDPWDRIVILPEEMAGVWTNLVRITASAHEFTIDFGRIDFASPDGEAILVARVAMSSLLFTQLMDAMDRAWTAYADHALPREMNDGGERPEPP